MILFSWKALVRVLSVCVSSLLLILPAASTLRWILFLSQAHPPDSSPRSDGVTPSRCFPWSLPSARRTTLQLLHRPQAGQVLNALQLLLSLQKLPFQSLTH